MTNSLKNKGCCIACGAELFEEPILALNNMPASAQDIPDKEQVKEDHGLTLNLCQCRKCGLIQFDCKPVSYYRDVIRAGGFSTTMVELRRSQYQHFIEKYHLKGKKFIEAGCGRGEFLSVLKEFPVEAYGIEHKEDLVNIARENGLSVECQFTENEDTKIINGPFDAFLSFNFLEHQPDPKAMLNCIWNNLTEDGLGLITVPSFEYIMEYDGFYELIRDHLAYFTFDTLEALLNHCGFEVLEKEMINRDTISVIVKKVRARKKCEKKDVKINLETGKKLLESFQVLNAEINSYIDHLTKEGKTIAIWGASHQGFTLAATTRLGERVSYMIDSAPFKQGKYAPTSHLPIVAPDYFYDHPVDEIMIVAPGYTEEIAAIIKQKFGDKVHRLCLKSNHMEEIL